MDEDCHDNGVFPRQSCWVPPESPLRENPLSVQPLPVWDKPAGEFNIKTHQIDTSHTIYKAFSSHAGVLG